MKGEILDEKYRIEKELGRGGMGAVYLATHIGTERPVAIKVISPEYMKKPEFVERFRREAKAAGRLRHPNVVDVTDFGFAETSQGEVAYLVMEYLDGCTLAEILEEEKKLSLSWSLDIIEQICSAVHQAHLQGVIHRDLKPENIWLEPNQRGGYTVKVLDFGIAKLEELDKRAFIESESVENIDQNQLQSRTQPKTPDKSTLVENSESTLIKAGSPENTIDAEVSRYSAKETDSANLGSKTEVAVPFSERETLFVTDLEQKSTIISLAQGSMQTKAEFSKPSSKISPDLTKVGTVLGTPTYMSPEQCRGESLDARSDIYSLGVIAYRMLAGKAPFRGDFEEIMQAHIKKAPPPLEADHIPRKVKQVILEALSKDPAERPQTAQAFASKLKAANENIGKLLQKALVIFSENVSAFLLLGILASLPTFLISLTKLFLNLTGVFLFPTEAIDLTVVLLSFASYPVYIFFYSITVAMTTWMVAQKISVPLRSIHIGNVASSILPKLKKLLVANFIGGIVAFIGLMFCLIPGIWFSTRYLLISPVLVIEEISIRDAFKRSAQLVKRSYKTALAYVLLTYFATAFAALVLSFLANSLVRTYIPSASQASDVWAIVTSPTKLEENIMADTESNEKAYQKVYFRQEVKRMLTLKNNGPIFYSITYESFWFIFNILFIPFLAAATALFYFKTRLEGGESLQDLLERFEKEDLTQSKWQQKMKMKLTSLGR